MERNLMYGEKLKNKVIKKLMNSLEGKLMLKRFGFNGLSSGL